MIRWTIRNRKITFLVVMILAVWGIYEFYSMPKQENPDFNAPFAMIVTLYPGASPQDVSELVTKKIDQEIHEIKGVANTSTQSRNSASIIVIELEDDADVEEAWDQLYRSMDNIQKELPNECLPIQVNTDLYKTAGMIISLSSNQYGYEELEAYANRYTKVLGKTEGITSFDIIGQQDKQITVEVDIKELNQLPYSMEDLSKLIASQNIKIPVGTLDSENGKISIDTTGTYTSIEEIENLLILVSKDSGSALRLKDIATVRYTYSEDNVSIRHNGTRGILLTAYFKDGQNILAIGDEVKKTIEEISMSMPSDLKVDFVLYQPDDVNLAMKDFMQNLLGGIFIVILVVFLGLGFRNAIIVSVAIPLSMLMTFITMPLMGIPIHKISIVGLIISLGMLVDNAIVVSDAIQVELDRGIQRFEACVDGVKQVAIPVLTSTLTTIATFVALLFLKGMAGTFILSLPKLLIVALLSSYLIALFVTPTLAYIFFKPTEKQRDGLRVVRHGFEQLLTWGLKYPKATLSLGVLVVILAGLLVMSLNASLFPIADNGILYMDIYSDSVDDLERTKEIVEDIEAILIKEEAVGAYTTAIGGSLPKFYYALGVYPNSADFAQIMARFAPDKDMNHEAQQAYIETLQNKIIAEVVGAKVEVKLLKQAMPVPGIKFIVTGDDLDTLRVAGDRVKQIVRSVEGTTKIYSDYSPKEFEFYVDVNPAIGMYYGISKYDVQKELSLAIAGREISTFVYQGVEYPILISGNLKDVEQVNQFGIKSSIIDQKSPVEQVADIGQRRQVTNIKSYNQDYAIIVSGDAKRGYSPSKLATMMEAQFKGEKFQDVTITEAGEKYNIRKLFGDVGKIAVVAVLLVYLVLLIQFKSYLEPLLICITLPLACVGSLLGLYIFRQELSFTALIGMVSLIGIVVNNAIVLLDFIKEERALGKKVRQACVDAVEKRFRPIILSSFTTVMGLIPLALSGSVLFEPMSIALIFGILFSTLLSLVFFPVVYYMAYRKTDNLQL